MNSIETMSDAELVALCVWREARSETTEARQGVYSVIRNRVGPKFRPTLREVVLQPYQFSSFNASDPQHGIFPDEKHSADWMAWLAIRDMVARQAGDNTAGANFYHDLSIQPPFIQWLGKKATLDDLLAKGTVAYGRLKFYKL